MLRNRHGFTLIEVIIALTILSFLSLFTVEAIQRALQTKAKVQGDIDKNATLRDALRTMERDINMAFNYHDPYVQLYNLTQDVRLKAAQAKSGKAVTPNPGETQAQAQARVQAQGQTTGIDPEKYKKKTEKVYTQFIGTAESVDFTSLSNVRMMEDSPLSSQAEIGYKLKACRRRSNQEQSSNCLWRRVANYLHDDITRDGQETVLLENVTEFKLRYLGPGKEDEGWVNSWSTANGSDDVTKGKFPYAVEITLAVKDNSSKSKDKELRMTSVAAVRNPNNPKDDPKNAAGNPATATPGSK